MEYLKRHGHRKYRKKTVKLEGAGSAPGLRAVALEKVLNGVASSEPPGVGFVPMIMFLVQSRG